jgi:hypothetical protein
MRVRTHLITEESVMRKPSTWIAALALFVALGGTAVAARHYLITNTSQIKPSVLKKLKGNMGPAGPAGPSNLSGLISVTGPTVAVPSGQVVTAIASCPAGSHVVSGGGNGSIAGIGVSEMSTDHLSWFIIVPNLTNTGVLIHAEAECAGAGQAVAASVPLAVRARAARQRAELVARLAAELQASKH